MASWPIWIENSASSSRAVVLRVIAQFDLQNINGQVVEKLTVEAHDLIGQTQFDLLVDGLPAVQVAVDLNGDAFVEYSSDPTGTELPFPLSFPPLAPAPASEPQPNRPATSSKRTSSRSVPHRDTLFANDAENDPEA